MKMRYLGHYTGLTGSDRTHAGSRCGFTAKWSDRRVSKCHWTLCCGQPWETLWDSCCCTSTVWRQAAESAVSGKGSWCLQRRICRGFRARHAGCPVQWLARPHCTETGLGTLPLVHPSVPAPVAQLCCTVTARVPHLARILHDGANQSNV